VTANWLFSLNVDYRAVENQGSLFSIHPRPNPNCPVGGPIQQTLEQVYGEAQQALESQLASRTVADVVCVCAWVA
jgi:hypothetical protein